MFIRLARLMTVLALLLFIYAQWQGWNLFEDHADGGRPGSGGGSRQYHK